jgi:drug/metabolite transporter (DMT)-like permease
MVAIEPVFNPVWVALATSEKPGRYALIGGVVIVVTIVSYNIWAARNNERLTVDD